MQRTLLCILIVTLASLSACDRSSARDQTPPDAIESRLVVLSPAIAAMLAEVGAADLIVGRHDFDLTLRHLPAAGHQGAIDYEMLLALEPTHIFIEWGDRPLPARLVALSRQHGWTIEDVRLVSLQDIARTADNLHARFGTDQDSLRPSERLDFALRPRDPSAARAGRVLLLGALEPPAAIGPGSFHHEILVRLGAAPAIEHGSPWIELDHEDLLALAPDAIILIMPETNGHGIGKTGRAAAEALGPIKSLLLPAIKNDRVAILNGPLYLTPSTAMIQCSEDLAEVLGGWADSQKQSE